MFIPMFQWNVFRTNLVKEGYITHEQLEAMKKECYTMRKENPVGRTRSNNASGWQSNDGVNDRPIFQSLLNGVEGVFNNELFPLPVSPTKYMNSPGLIVKLILSNNFFSD